MYSLILWSIEKLYLSGSVKGAPFILPGVVFLLRDWDNKGVVLRCFEAIATILLNCATRPSLSRQKCLSFFKVVKRCPCRAVQLHEGRVCWRKAMKTPSRPFKLLPVGFVVLLAIFWGGKSTSVFLIWVIFEVKRCPCSCMRRRRFAGARLQSRWPWDRRPSNSQACKLQAGTSPPWGAVSVMRNFQRNKVRAMV